MRSSVKIQLGIGDALWLACFRQVLKFPWNALRV